MAYVSMNNVSLLVQKHMECMCVCVCKWSSLLRRRTLHHESLNMGWRLSFLTPHTTEGETRERERGFTFDSVSPSYTHTPSLSLFMRVFPDSSRLPRYVTLPPSLRQHHQSNYSLLGTRGVSACLSPLLPPTLLQSSCPSLSSLMYLLQKKTAAKSNIIIGGEWESKRTTERDKEGGRDWHNVQLRILEENKDACERWRK